MITLTLILGFVKVGLLPRDNEQQIPFAYKLYKREDKDGIDLCAGFKQTFCQNVKIHFVGVWCVPIILFTPKRLDMTAIF